MSTTILSRILFIAAVLCVASKSHAVLIEFTFDAVIQSMSHNVGYPGSLRPSTVEFLSQQGIGLGASLTVKLIIDDSTPNALGSLPYWGNYRNGVVGGSIQVGNHFYEMDYQGTADTPGNNLAYDIWNDHPTIEDHFETRFLTNGGGAEIQSSWVNIDLHDSTLLAFDSVATPSNLDVELFDPFKLDEFLGASAFFSGSGIFWELMVFEQGATPDAGLVQAEILSISQRTLVPLPPTGIMLVSALMATFVLRRTSMT